MRDDLIVRNDATTAIKEVSPVAKLSTAELQELSTIPVAPRTTLEEDKVTEAQRGFNTTWENTQARIATSVVLTTCAMVVMKVVAALFFPQINAEINNTIPSEWWTILGLVIGFYFGRTNHSRQGDGGANGVGRNQTYT